jgi:RNA 3'-terminal phosphate cyclase (ATP)
MDIGFESRTGLLRKLSNSRTLLSPRFVRADSYTGLASIDAAKPAPDAGGTTSNLKAVGSNPIRRASGDSSEVEHQERLAKVCRRRYQPFGYDIMTDWITIDGSEGEGGGQILRTALALSLVTGRPFRIEAIRAARRKPGLLRQHLTAVHAAAEVSDARVSGAELGSRSLSFEPSQVRGGDYRLAVGTAGSATLVLQTVLPGLLFAREPSRLTLEGGTHNPYAPPFDFLAKTFLPILRRMGASVEVSLETYGFYPAGGGRFTVAIEPCATFGRLSLLERGATRVHARAIVALLSENIAKRELSIVRERLEIDRVSCRVETVDTSVGPGNVLMIVIESETVSEVVTGFGVKGVSAEKVASNACDEAQAYIAGCVPVGIHLADQLLIPMALGGGGTFRSLKPTAHTITNADVIRRFLDVTIAVELESDGTYRVSVGSAVKERTS